MPAPEEKPAPREFVVQFGAMGSMTVAAASEEEAIKVALAAAFPGAAPRGEGVTAKPAGS